VNTANLRRILRARKVDRDQLAQLKSLEKRLRAQGGDHHRLDFALPDPQVCVDDLFGRLYPKRERGGSTPSLQGLKRDVRKALAHDQYTDADMVNAHPVILGQLFLKLGLACPALERYVAEREAVLAETGLGRDEAKRAFITLMYGGERKDPTPFMAEFLTNATTVLASEAYERYRTLAEAKKPANVLGGGISFVAQDLERQLVCCAIQTLQSKGYEVGTIIHDGFLVRSLLVKDQDLRDAEEAVGRTHGYEVRFIKKSLGDFDESALWDPTDEDEGHADAASHTDLGRAFMEWLEDRGHRLVRAEKKIFWYDPEHGVYLESEKLRQVRRYMNACPALPKANRGETGFQSKLIVQIEGLLEDDPAFHDKIIDTTLRKIPFSNGVYCCETQRLVDYDADMYFLEKGSVEYDPQSEALKADVYRRAFLDVVGTEEIARYVLRSLARAMAGETEDEVFFTVKARTNSGKGLLTLLISKAFFSKYGNINATNFCQKRTDGDMTKMGSWKCQTRHKRIGVASEAPKKRGCGGDHHTARTNGVDEMIFFMETKFLLFVNDMSSIEDCDEATAERLRVIPTAYKYLLDDNYEAEKDKAYVRRADPTIKSEWIKRPEVIRTFAQLVCEAYENTRPDAPAAILETSAKYLEDDNVDAKIQALFDPADPNEYVLVKDFNAAVKRADINMNSESLNEKLGDWGYKKQQKKISGRNQYVIHGMRLVVERPEY
jgi:phage/plasmid-associated DNA primase